MKKKLLIPLTVWLLWHSCQDISDQTQNTLKDTLIQTNSVIQKTPKITYEISLSSEQQHLIEQIVKGYFAQYPCDMNTLTISADMPKDKENEQTLAHAKSRHIYLNPEHLTDNTSLKNTILHELFHTIKPDSLTLTSPHTLKDGYTIVGYHGLSIVVKNDKQQTQFGLFEDAAAEALASMYDQNYQVPNIYYANIGSLMLKMIHRWWVFVDDLIYAQSHNDFDFLCEKILRRKITLQDVESLMSIFNEVYMTQDDLTEEALKKIEKMKK